MGGENKGFYFRDDELIGSNIEAIFCSFLDYSWGVELDEYLKKNGLLEDETGAIKDVLEENKPDYQMLVQELENGMYFKTQIWLNDDGTYTGESSVLNETEKMLMMRKLSTAK